MQKTMVPLRTSTATCASLSAGQTPTPHASAAQMEQQKHQRCPEQDGGDEKKEEHTFADLDEAHDDNEDQGQKFASSEDVLDTRGPADAEAVHPSQQH